MLLNEVVFADVATDKEILGLLDTHVDALKKGYKEPVTDDDKEPTPFLVVHTLHDGKKQGILVGITEFDQVKRKTFENIGKTFAEKVEELGTPYCITFSSEAWMAKLNTKDKKYKQTLERLKKKHGYRISEYPKKYKKEIAMVTCLTADGRMAMTSFEIKRDKKDKRNGLKLDMHKPTLDKKMESSLLDGFYHGFAIGMAGW